MVRDSRKCLRRTELSRADIAGRTRADPDPSNCGRSVHMLPMSQLTVVDGAGHMGPLTHTATVSALIMQHILDAEYRCAGTTLVCADSLAHSRPNRVWFL